jgi:hypothetical protein
VIHHSTAIILALEGVLDYNPRHTNRPPPDLWIEDRNYLALLREIVHELRTLNGLLAVKKQSPRRTKITIQHLQNSALKCADGYLKHIGTGGAYLTLMALATLFSQIIGADEVVRQLLTHIPSCSGSAGRPDRAILGRQCR